MADRHDVLVPNAVMAEFEALTTQIVRADELGLYELPPEGVGFDTEGIETFVRPHVPDAAVRSGLMEALAASRYIKLDIGSNAAHYPMRRATLLGEAANAGVWTSVEVPYRHDGTRNQIVTKVHRAGDDEPTEKSYAPRPLHFSDLLHSDKGLEPGAIMYTPLRAVAALNGLLRVMAPDYPLRQRSAQYAVVPKRLP